MSSDYQIQRDRHYDKLLGLYAELRGVTRAALELHDEGRLSADKALAQIREEHAKTKAAIEAAWDEYTGSTR